MMARRRKNLEGPGRVEYTAMGARVVEVARRDGWNLPAEVSADWDLLADLNVLRRLSAGLYDSFSYYRGMIDVCVRHILGPDGFGLKARTNDPRVNAELETVWQNWCEAPEVTGRLNWNDVERMALRAKIVDGDCLALKTSDGVLQMLEAMQFAEWARQAPADQGNVVVLGVELTPAGRPVAFHVREMRPGQAYPMEVRRLPADACLHVADFVRFTQNRGTPLAMTSLADANRLRDVVDSSAAAWVLQSRMAFGVTREDPAEELAALAEAEDSARVEDGDITTRFFNVDQATVFYGKPGEEVKPIDQNRPGQNFGESVKSFLHPIAMGLGLPLEVATQNYGEMNLSSARAANNAAQVAFAWHQQQLERQLHRPVYEWVVLRYAVEKGREDLLTRPDLLAHEWVRPAWLWLDPASEVEALGDELEMGLKTHGDVLKSRGVERASWLPRRAQEIVDAVRAEEQIILETGREDVRGAWRTLCGMTTSEGAQTAVIQAAAQERLMEKQQGSASHGGTEGTDGGVATTEAQGAQSLAQSTQRAQRTAGEGDAR